MSEASRMLEGHGGEEECRGSWRGGEGRAGAGEAHHWERQNNIEIAAKNEHHRPLQGRINGLLLTHPHPPHLP